MTDLHHSFRLLFFHSLQVFLLPVEMMAQGLMSSLSLSLREVAISILLSVCSLLEWVLHSTMHLLLFFCLLVLCLLLPGFVFPVPSKKKRNSRKLRLRDRLRVVPRKLPQKKFHLLQNLMSFLLKSDMPSFLLLMQKRVQSLCPASREFVVRLLLI